MALYISTPVGTKEKDIVVRKNLLGETLPNYKHVGMEMWLRGNVPENPQETRQTLEKTLGNYFNENFALTVQARRYDPNFKGNQFDPKRHYDLTTQRGVDNLLVNAKAAKELGAKAVVAAPWIGVFKFPKGYTTDTESFDYRYEKIDTAITNAEKISEEIGIKVALEHSTVPLYGDLNPNLKGSLFDLGFGLFEHTRQVPGDMLVLDTCHVESARNIVKRLQKNGGDLMVPGVMGARKQPIVFEAVRLTKPFEVHYADFAGEWNPYSTIPTKHNEGVIPGDGVIGTQTFKDITKLLYGRANSGEDVIIVAEPNEEDFMNPINSRETLKRIYSWVKENFSSQ